MTTPQPAQEMVEIVAKAIASEPIEIEKDGRKWLVISWESSSELFRLMARKAIAALSTQEGDGK